MDNQDIIEKIKKLLSLSQSSNIHEAEIALAKANKLMEEYQIEHIHLIPKENISHSDKERVINQHYVWARVLASACAKLFDCKTIRHNWDKSFTFVGQSANILMAQQLFWHLFKSWKTLCKIDYQKDRPNDRKLYRKSHGLGFANIIYSRVQELTEERHANIVKSTGTDLVVVKDAKINKYMEENFNLVSRKSRSLTTSSSGYMNGLVAGEKVNLSAPIDHNNQEKLDG